MSETIKPNPVNKSESPKKQVILPDIHIQEKHQNTPEKSKDIVREIKDAINNDKLVSLKDYPIRDLVKHAEQFGPYLKQQRLETNQVRKFLDAVNRIKANLAEKGDFSGQIDEVILLKPKLAYAAARQRAAKPLAEVMSTAIDKVRNKEDFERLVQLIESIIAYHKAEGGK
ncbi:type III-A CRISPR-associated protein Csm2 [Nostoc sp.]|uniref:type III-A CRISPR-associated protein Csm2 n=1 Tax=Nostoc sp. TaxID=1180 RepID=UPI002FFA6F63